jgi:hypothetical protein
LHPADVQLQVGAARGQRVQAAFGTPGQVERRPDSVCSREEPLNRARQAATASRS